MSEDSRPGPDATSSNKAPESTQKTMGPTDSRVPDTIFKFNGRGGITAYKDVNRKPKDQKVANNSVYLDLGRWR